MTRLDANNDGYISREDYELMGKQAVEFGELTKEEADSTYKRFVGFADALNLQPGVKIPIDEAARELSDRLLSHTPAEIRGRADMHFDLIDTNRDEKISTKEFKAYFRIINPACPEAEVNHSFNVIDTKKDGIISREEFAAAAEDFMVGVEETELSKAFYGPLID